jgi:hypothetical protein
MIILDKKKQEFTFGNLFCGLEPFGAAWESGTHVLSIRQLKKIEITRPKAHSIYQRMGEAPWGHIRKSWPDIDVVTPPPEATVRYEWMERLMPMDVTVDIPDRVLVIGTLDD